MADDVFGIDQSPGEAGAEEGQDEEADVSRVADPGVAFSVFVEAKGDLFVLMLVTWVRMAGREAVVCQRYGI